MCVIVASAFDLFFLLPLVFSYADSVKVTCNDVQLVKVQLGMPSDVSELICGLPKVIAMVCLLASLFFRS
jgi:hypothetical protein